MPLMMKKLSSPLLQLRLTLMMKDHLVNQFSHPRPHQPPKQQLLQMQLLVQVVLMLQLVMQEPEVTPVPVEEMVNDLYSDQH